MNDAGRPQLTPAARTCQTSASPAARGKAPSGDAGRDPASRSAGRAGSPRRGTDRRASTKPRARPAAAGFRPFQAPEPAPAAHRLRGPSLPPGIPGRLGTTNRWGTARTSAPTSSEGADRQRPTSGNQRSEERQQERQRRPSGRPPGPSSSCAADRGQGRSGNLGFPTAPQKGNSRGRFGSRVTAEASDGKWRSASGRARAAATAVVMGGSEGGNQRRRRKRRSSAPRGGSNAGGADGPPLATVDGAREPRKGAERREVHSRSKARPGWKPRTARAAAKRSGDPPDAERRPDQKRCSSPVRKRSDRWDGGPSQRGAMTPDRR